MTVYLVGAGPGDPGLLTVRADEVLRRADVVVYDRLSVEALLELAPPAAERISVGKAPGHVTMTQTEINALLIDLAGRHATVVRLKGGDPFVFGRAAEEMIAVRAAGIPVDVVPGITAAHACAASIGLPLTLREKVRQFSVVTGATGAGLPDHDWAALARPGHAFAIYMGVRSAPAITAQLLAEGAAPGLPVIVVENGTRPGERVLQATLDGLPDALRRHAVKGPAVIFVGLDWADAHLSPPRHVIVAAKVERAAASGNRQVDDQPYMPE